VGLVGDLFTFPSCLIVGILLIIPFQMILHGTLAHTGIDIFIWLLLSGCSNAIIFYLMLNRVIKRSDRRGGAG
jgi:hypothetical protein